MNIDELHTHEKPFIGINREGRTVLVIDETDKNRLIVVSMASAPLFLERWPINYYLRFYDRIYDAPIQRSAKTYLNHSLLVGGAPDFIDALRKIIPVSAKDADRAISRYYQSRPAKLIKVEYSTAFDMFLALIKAGSLTDDDILKTVQFSFDIDDNTERFEIYRKLIEPEKTEDTEDE
jgi:hypothetical protein